MLKKLNGNEHVDSVVINSINKELYDIFDYSLADSSLLVASRCIKLSKTIGYKKGEADALYNSGFFFNAKGETSKAFDSLIKARIIYESIKDTFGILRCLTQSGVIYLSKKNYALAAIEFERAYALSIKINYAEKASQNRYLCGLCYTQTGDLAKAEICLKAVEKEYNNKNLIHNLHECYTGLADLNFKKKEYEIAKGYYQKNYDYFLKEKEYIGLANNAYGLGKVYLQLKEKTQAIKYLLEAYKYNVLSGERYLRDEFVKAISDFYSSEGDFKNAYKYMVIYHDIHDSLFNSDHTKTLNSLQTKLDLARNQAQIELLNTQHERDKYTRYFMGAGVLVLLMIALLFFFRFRYKSIANKKLEHLNIELESTLSNLKSAQDQLVQQEKLASLGALTAGIAHEMQNPLNFINNFSDLTHEIIDDLKEAKTEEERHSIITDLKKYLEKISHHGKRAENIVNGMLKHGRNDITEKNSFDINHLCNETLSVVYQHERLTKPDFKCEIITYFDANLKEITAVQSDISRVMLNIISNAFYAVRDKEDATVTITTDRVGDGVEIKVKDNGVGIPDAIKQKIFEPFFTTKPTNQGTGLGLSLSYDIIKAHGGDLKMTSAEGEFTEFIILLPIA
ncbi:MAG: ATP-binding protein [Bacteroidetes bacterium]|nr:ATP-binding protein [Bacteroidota bacterium]